MVRKNTMVAYSTNYSIIKQFLIIIEDIRFLFLSFFEVVVGGKNFFLIKGFFFQINVIFHEV